jgi:hypothetical protein
MRWLITLLVLLLARHSSAATLEVGPGRVYPTLEEAARAAQDGDHVLIAAGEYLECAFWTANNLVIEGTGKPEDTVVSDLACGGKALFVVTGNDITVRNMTFSRVRVGDGNGAGIRADGRNLTIENVVFFNNQTGLLASSRPDSAVIIRDSAFIRNGGCARSCTNGLSVGDVAALRIERSRFEGTKSGHQIAGRARVTEITGCDIADGATGNSSHLIDLGNAEQVVLRGNHLQKGVKSENHRAAIWIVAGGRGGGEIIVQDNTFQSDGPWRSVFVVNRTGMAARLSGNEVSGRVQLLVGFGTVE